MARRRLGKEIRYRKPPQPPQGHFVMPKPVVRDFSTRQDIIEHARGEGATHVVVVGSGVTLYFPSGAGYEEARAWRQNGYWHAPAPGSRKVVDRLPKEAEPIDAHVGGARRAAETPRGRVVRDYVPVDHRGRPLSGPTKDYGEAKRQADQAGGYVKFDTGRAPAMHEAFGRRTQWTDWMILDAIDKGNQVPPEAEARAVKLAQRGLIDTTGTWRLTPKGRSAVDRRLPVAAEAARRRTPAARRGLIPATGDAVMKLAAKLSQQTDGGMPKYIEGGFRWSEKNESAQFTTVSPEYGQKVVVVVSIFEDGSTAIHFFSDEGLSGTATYENISHFTYGGVDVPEMVKDIDWVRTTVDGYAASWQQPDAEVDESRRPVARRSKTRRSAAPRRRTSRR